MFLQGMKKKNQHHFMRLLYLPWPWWWLNIGHSVHFVLNESNMYNLSYRCPLCLLGIQLLSKSVAMYSLSVGLYVVYHWPHLTWHGSVWDWYGWIRYRIIDRVLNTVTDHFVRHSNLVGCIEGVQLETIVNFFPCTVNHITC